MAPMSTGTLSGCRWLMAARIRSRDVIYLLFNTLRIIHVLKKNDLNMLFPFVSFVMTFVTFVFKCFKIKH